MPRVVIVGAGFGGLRAARRLSRAGAGLGLEVLLLDRNNYHLFTPLLYQVASALLDPSDIAQPVRALVRSLPGVDFRLGEVVAIDLERRKVATGTGEEYGYDHLLLAAGSTTNYFGNLHIQTVGFPVKTLEEGLDLRVHVLEQFERAQLIAEPAERRRLMSFVVAGGGPTGVEFAGALAELVRLVLRLDFKSLDLGIARIHLVEAADGLLTAFDPRLRVAALRSLRGKGVDVHLGTTVERVEPKGVWLGDGTLIPAATLVWTAGVKAAELAGGLAAAGCPTGGSGRVLVDPMLRLPGHPEVYVIGDMAELEPAAGGPLPMLAPVAIQQADLAAFNLLAAIRGGAARPFRYRDRGIMATIGRHAGVAQIGGLRLSGRIGWLSWLFVHLLLIIGLRNRLLVLFGWSWDYLFFDRPVRLILRAHQRRHSEPG